MNAKLAAVMSLKNKYRYTMDRIYGIIKKQIEYGQFSADINGEKHEVANAIKSILENDGYVVCLNRTNADYSTLHVAWPYN